MKHQVGMVFSGGGVRGAAHAGALKALEENGIEPTQLSGSSSGAMVGALYAVGYKPEEILEFFRGNTNIFRWQNFSRKKPGILDAEKYQEIFEPWLSGHTFETLSKALTICVTDVLKGQFHFFSSGELVRPILASAAVPGVFSPVEIDGNWYIDGGTMNNFPIEPLLGKCNGIIGSFVSPKKTLDKWELTNSLKLISRANELSFIANSIYKFGHCEVILSPENLWKYGLFDLKKLDEIYTIGYEHTMKKIEDIFKIIEKNRFNKEEPETKNNSDINAIATHIS